MVLLLSDLRGEAGTGQLPNTVTDYFKRSCYILYKSKLQGFCGVDREECSTARTVCFEVDESAPVF